MKRNIYIETERLLIGEIIPSDNTALYSLDSDPIVHQYLGNSPIKDRHTIDTIIQHIRTCYKENGIGRWAVLHKETEVFLGWCGLHFITKEKVNNHCNFYDLGYRFIHSHWGFGYATESAKAIISYGFEKLSLPVIYGFCESKNHQSRKVLLKSGLSYIETFKYNTIDAHWFMIKNDKGKQNG